MKGFVNAVTTSVVPMLFPGLAGRILARWGLDAAMQEADSGGFDRAHYEQAHGRRFGSREAALLHYLVVGSRQGLRPRPDFDPADYRRANPDVVRAGYEPFGHYLHFGRSEGRAGTAAADAPDEGSPPLPEMAPMMRHRSAGATPVKVDVVIPVYGSRRLALQAINSVLSARVATAYELVIVDDASDDRALIEDLRSLAAKGLLTLLTNERNIGFVGSANRGLTLHGDRDVVLLNSDTRVFDGWLDRLMSALHSTPRTATATPLSNAATILSYPIALRDNGRPSGMDYAQLDRLCAELAHSPLELPTGVGFCMGIRRDCLDAVGGLDADRFGRGYGEENDFCMRASAAGWRHVAAADLFVWHRGAGSFGGERDARLGSAMATLEERYPGYGALIQRFIDADPLRPLRAALDAARVRSDPRTKILCAGAGDDAWVSRPDSLVLRLSPEIGPFYGQFRLVVADFQPIPNLDRVDRETGLETLQRMLRELTIREVHLASKVLSIPVFRRLKRAAEMAGIVVRTVAR